MYFRHNEGVQCLSFSPVAQQLLSCSSSEISEFQVIIYTCSGIICLSKNNIADSHDVHVHLYMYMYMHVAQKLLKIVLKNKICQIVIVPVFKAGQGFN